jgi:hypothetical protein
MTGILTGLTGIFSSSDRYFQSFRPVFEFF